VEKPPLLLLVHRIPYPPNKGDKVRSFQLMRELATRYRVYLATFIDHPDDWAHVATLRQWCADVFVAGIRPVSAKLKSLTGLLSAEALSLPYYRNAKLGHWVRQQVTQQQIHKAVVFSSPMAQYLEGLKLAKVVMDFCDVDSAKWHQYAPSRPWPMSWLYRREGERLLAFERQVARQVDSSLFATVAEARMFRELAPESADRVAVMENGVDADFFSPEHSVDNPYPSGANVIAFTGAMNYWPNIDAVQWFAAEVFPLLQQRVANLQFYIVGMNPTPAVLALAKQAGIVVTGSVPDIRPYLKFSRLVVVPLRIARGIQNKILEAMAMACPVIASASCMTGVNAVRGEEIMVAEQATDFVTAIEQLIQDESRCVRIGRVARQRVLNDYSWHANFSLLHQQLEGSTR
jgi:sugar transferase (PEP-CTERM/EpsH1 system associated)